MKRLSTRKRLWLRPAICAGVLVMSASPSDAQVIPAREIIMLPRLSDEYVAPEDTPVRYRSYPEFQPLGIRAGSWMFNPTLAAGTFYDSNVFSSSSNAQSDIAAQLGADLRARTLWERHGIELGVSSRSVVYRKFSTMDHTDATIWGNGHFDIDHSTQVLGTFNAAYLHVLPGSLDSPLGAVEPTPYSRISGDVTVRKEIGRVTAAVGAGMDSYDFGSTRTGNGSTISLDPQDGQIYKAHGRIGYAFSEKSAFFTSVEGNWRNLRGTPAQSLESNGYRALAGFDLELTHLIKGEIAAGYMKQHFFASSIGDIEGPAYRAMLTWSPSRQIDVHLNAEQMVTQSWDLSTSGILASAVQLGVDYEFRPNVVLLTAATYERDRFQGQTRNDNVYVVDTRIKYLPNNVAAITLGYTYTRRDSNAPDASFDKHRVSVNASARF